MVRSILIVMSVLLCSCATMRPVVPHVMFCPSKETERARAHYLAVKQAYIGTRRGYRARCRPGANKYLKKCLVWLSLLNTLEVSLLRAEIEYYRMSVCAAYPIKL